MLHAFPADIDPKRGGSPTLTSFQDTSPADEKQRRERFLHASYSINLATWRQQLSLQFPFSPANKMSIRTSSFVRSVAIAIVLFIGLSRAYTNITEELGPLL